MSTKTQRAQKASDAIRAREQARRPTLPEPPKTTKKRATPDQVFASALPIEALDEVRVYEPEPEPEPDGE